MLFEASSGTMVLVSDILNKNGAGWPMPLQLLVFMTLLAIIPSLLLMMTCFTRFIIVLSILRQAIGLNQSPPNMVLVGLALFMTFFAMQPVFHRIDQQVVGPYVAGSLPMEAGLKTGTAIFHDYMIKNTRKKDILLFTHIAGEKKYAKPNDVPLRILLPAFATSELQTAFQIGILIYLPFLIIDMLVAILLTALGMMMMSPAMIALPFKLLFFVMIDGWALLLGALVTGAKAGI